jgi:hypothetical protein
MELIKRIFPSPEIPGAPAPGIYHRMLIEGFEGPHRFHLRLDPDQTAVLIVDASVVLHLNPTAAEHAYHMVQGLDDRQAAEVIADRYRVSLSKALADQRQLREQILALAATPDLDPVMYLGMERTDPTETTAQIPYRLDCALTYRIDASGKMDPLARERVDTELSLDAWTTILESAWGYGIPHVTFTGGEPTLRDDLPELVAVAEGLGQVTGLMTDGQRLSEPGYLERLDQAGLDHILIVYDPEKPDALQGLKSALATEIFTAVHFPMQAGGEISASVWEEMAEYGVTAVSISIEGAVGENPEALESARSAAAARGFDLIWDLPAPYSENNPIRSEIGAEATRSPRPWLYVEPDGDVLPAQGVNRILGNALQDGWAGMWAKIRDA